MFVGASHLSSIGFNRPEFENDLKGGLQLQLNAGKLPTDDYPMFNGGTVQVNNVLDLNGNTTGSSTLGQSVSFIFNDEFRPKTSPNSLVSRGEPLTRIDLSGYGASIFSNWLNPLAQMAQTSQIKFGVWVGRTAHEVIQVKSIVYPGVIQEKMAQMSRALDNVPGPDPLSDELGQHRILRTSPLTEAPLIC